MIIIGTTVKHVYFVISITILFAWGLNSCIDNKLALHIQTICPGDKFCEISKINPMLKFPCLQYPKLIKNPYRHVFYCEILIPKNNQNNNHW